MENKTGLIDALNNLEEELNFLKDLGIHMWGSNDSIYFAKNEDVDLDGEVFFPLHRGY